MGKDLNYGNIMGVIGAALIILGTGATIQEAMGDKMDPRNWVSIAVTPIVLGVVLIVLRQVYNHKH